MMEVIKCGLCKEEIEYAQRCRVYIKTNEARPYQRISKRPHIGRYKLISTAKSTEHISFARRLKRIRAIRNNSKSSTNLLKVDQKESPSIETKEITNENTSSEESVHLEKPDIDTNEEHLKLKKLESSGKPGDHLLTSEPSNLPQESPLNEKRVHEDLESPKQSTAEKKTSSKSILQNRQRTSAIKKAFERRRIKRALSTKKLSPNKGTKRKDMSHPHFQSSFEEYIKPILSKNNSTPYKEYKRKNSDMSVDFDQHKKMQMTSTPKSVKNGSVKSKKSDCETYYWLEMPKPKQPELRKLGYNFENLVTEVKHMKLPNPDWKIKIMVHKQEMVSVSFTKKLSPEKVVSVNAKSAVCDIVLDGKKIILLGSPVYIHSIKDLEVLLDIVNDLEADSPMITYLKPAA